jgi:hypothetical protein
LPETLSVLILKYRIMQVGFRKNPHQFWWWGF